MSAADLPVATGDEPVPARSSCSHPPASQTLLFHARDYITGEEFQVVSCASCGLSHTEPAPSPDQMSAYYPVSYYGTSRRFIGVIDWLLDRVNRRKVRRLGGGRSVRPGRLLEVGCGHGLLLSQFRRLGWQVTGTEISAPSSAYARDVLGLDVKIGDLRDLGLPAASYDLVVAWHVLEHLPDPAAQLREMARVLRPGGTAVIGVPNFGSMEARWTRDKWFHLDVPRHLSHFSPASLRRMFGDAGLEATQIGFFSPEHDYFSFVQSALNKLGLKHNMLYDLVRRGGAKVLHEGRPDRSPGSLVATVILAPVIGLVSLLWVPAAAIAGEGSAMIAFARKPASD